ncbi:hypothetical protein [Candidatus Chromulinivorax destructor]|uniref:hypothetical protein n=1 Tax=Candidatus Chromulinivorax destructor TaxID=2066483 RepID=UPI0013B3D442|nr:hypothetical protein [Candidatus Chromulinivorax destructor]
MGQASASFKRKIRNKFVRAIRRVEAQELSKEKYFNNKKREQNAQTAQPARS